MLNLAEQMIVTESTVTKEQLAEDFASSAKTSIFRKTAAAPLKILLENNCIKGSTLNFGKGKYDCDSNAIREVTHCQDYDYTHCPINILGRTWDTVYAGYVMNTLRPRSRQVVWSQVAAATKGTAYIAVRSDKDRGIRGEPMDDGVVTIRNTFQIGYTEQKLLSEAAQFFEHVEIVKGKSGFRIVKCSHSPF
ncbi:hypothetical protein A1QO_04285 [Vibrio genomosp. F10 str. ZF-129]|uniref:Uncharacterized protein n=1 Tax=Vibrio genomosp. F10 str. ZF-129 TaxID=1187848 RepID=A0A1E5BIS6_9VIBR|nr:hypothetical protein [Vibrio genomosp. F10]OEE37331.1 hypothetical protein A1QO_04285 [Vibrio genomosp. F10 str. ZF-129]